MSPPSVPSVPATIGRYRVVGHAGSGAFASVFEAIDERLESRVAVKVLADNWLYDPDVRRRFRDEAVLLRRLTGEHGARSLVQVFDIDQTTTGQPYFVMEWAAGKTLAERLRPGGWSIEQIRPVVRSLADGLTALHANGVIHRDIKPSNLLVLGSSERAEDTLLGETERLVLGDLGLAKDTHDERSMRSLIVGTERFAAPELLEHGHGATPSVDVFAATRVIEDVVGQHEHSAHLTPFLERGLAPTPSDRPESAQQWLADFEAIADSLRPTAVALIASSSTKERAPTSRRWIMLAVAMLVIAAVAAASWLRLGSSSIVGPDQIVSGETVSYRLDGVDEVLPWVDPAGDVVVARGLDVTGRLPGRISVSVAHEGNRHVRSVTVLPSPEGPEIIGPTEVQRGDIPTWTTDNVDGQQISWTASTGETSQGPDLSVTAVDDLVVRVTATDSAGITRGAQMQVKVTD